jgi:O-antigen ligase
MGVAVAAWALLVALMIQALIVSQSRGAYIAFLLLALGYGGFTLWRMVAQRRRPSLAQTAAPVLVGALLVVAVVFQWDTVTRKFDKESEVIAQAMAGDWDNPEPNSFGMRMYLYKWGVDAFLQKPWFGWGSDGPMHVIRHTGKPELPLKFNHFHNNYIDMLVRFGVVGSALFVGMLASFFWASARSVEAGTLERRSLTLFSMTIAAFALGSLSFSFLESSHGWFLLIFLGGMMLSADLWHKRSRKTH